MYDIIIVGGGPAGLTAATYACRAGKTVLAQGVGRGWGAQEPLISPTFVLVRRHERLHDSQKLYHIDFYRLQSAEIASLGLEEILGAPGAVAMIGAP